MIHSKQPSGAHHAFLSDVKGLCDRFDAAGMPGIERIALLAQVIGREIAALPDGPFNSSDVLRSVSLNIEQGNRDVTGALPVVGGPGHA